MINPTVRIVEVGPRDGLQAITETIPTELKIQLIKRLSQTGLKAIEATSFTSPRWIPQLADHQAVMRAVKGMQETTAAPAPTAAPDSGCASTSVASAAAISYSVLVPNLKGLLAAAEAGAREVGVFVAATQGFSRANNNCSVEESLARAREVAERARQLEIRVRGYVSCIFSCPFDGPTDPHRVSTVAQALLDMGCYEVSLGDTVGVGSPAEVRRLLAVLLKSIPASRLAGHFHDTYGQAVANVVAAYELGLRTFDSSVGGLGGCPYSPGAKGNLSTEDIVHTFEQMGIATGVDLLELAEIGHWINARLGKPNGSRAGAAIYSRRHNTRAQKSPRKRAIEWTLVKEDPEYQLFRWLSTVKIVLNRPRNGNALTRTMLVNLTALFNSLSKDPSIFHIVLTGSGKYFCTGMDLSTGGATAAKSDAISKQEQSNGLWQLFEAMNRTPQTTIALINGPTFGGGTGLAFVCDIRLAQPDVTFTMTEVKLGLCPATISKFVIREWGLSLAREAMLTARPVTAQELRRVGVIHGLTLSSASTDSPSIDSHRASLDGLLQHYLDKYLRHAAPQASARTKDLAAAAWRYSGDERQDKVIKDVFGWMIAPSDEARLGTDAFRAGRKDVDWEEEYRTRAVLGGNEQCLKPKL